MKVLIVGAGIGGLTAALAALKRGFDVEVYEQAPQLREVGAGLQLTDLLEVLVAAIGRDRIHLGGKCVGFSQGAEGVQVLFENHSSVRCDVLIGADGVHSQVRQSLFGQDRPQFTGIVVWRGIVPMEKLPKHMARMVGSNWVGPGAHVVHYPLRAGKVMNFVGALERSDWQVESWSARGTTEELAADFAG